MIVTWHTEEIVIHSTDNDETYRIPWKNAFATTQRLSGHMPYWLDDEHLLYSMGNMEEEWFIINPFTQEVTEWAGTFTPSEFNFVLSPDGEKALYNYWLDPFWNLNNGFETIEVPNVGRGSWHPNSSLFAAYTLQDDSFQPNELATFNLDGERLATIFDVPEEAEFVWRIENAWSPSGYYLVFATETLYLADMREQIVIDTCIPTRSVTVAWSPSSEQLALIERVHTDRQIQIIDLNRWQRYVVGYHDGQIIGWRIDDEE